MFKIHQKFVEKSQYPQLLLAQGSPTPNMPKQLPWFVVSVLIQQVMQVNEITV